MIAISWCRPSGYKPPALPEWKLEEPDSPKIDHELDGEPPAFSAVLRHPVSQLHERPLCQRMCICLLVLW